MIEWSREVIELGDLACTRFPSLTESELKLLCAVTTGEFVFGGPTDPRWQHHNDPMLSDFWGIERDIGSDLVRWMLVDSQATAFIDPHGLQVDGVRIVGMLDLSFITTQFPIFFRRCFLSEETSFLFARLASVQMVECLTRQIAADNLTVRGGLYLHNGFRCEGGISLISAEISGNLNFDGAKFLRSSGEAIRADRARIGGSVFLRNGFQAEGTVRFLGAEIGSNFDCRSGSFSNPAGVALIADRIVAAGNLLFCDGFLAQGEVRILGAHASNLNCSRGSFLSAGRAALAADGARVNGDVSLSAGFRASGAVHLVGVNIDGDLNCIGAELVADSAAEAERSTVKGAFFWRAVSNSKATPDRRFSLNLSHTSVGPITDERQSWPSAGNLRLDGFEYSQIAHGPVDATSRLDWLGRQSHGFWPQPYRQLAKVLQERGDDAGARKVLIKLEDLRRRHEKPKQPELSWSYLWSLLRWLWRGVLKYTIAYGYRPYYALGWAVLVVVFGSWLFGRGRVAGIVAPSDKDAYEFFTENAHLAPSYYPRFSAFFYSLDAFLPIINLGQKDHWMPNANLGVRVFGHKDGWWLRDYLWLHIILGWVLTTLFVAGISGVVSRRL